MHRFTTATTRSPRIFLMLLCSGWSAALALAGSPSPAQYQKKAGLAETLLDSRAALQAAPLTEPARTPAVNLIWNKACLDFPMECDWLMQDGGVDFASQFFSLSKLSPLNDLLIGKALAELHNGASTLRNRLAAHLENPEKRSDLDALRLYFEAAAQRRTQRLRTAIALAPKIVFTKRTTLRPSFFAYTEGQSDAQNERHFLPGSELCLLEWRDGKAHVRPLLQDPAGVIRDPAVSWDAQRLLFAWKKSLNEDDYHLYELEIATGSVRQITSGLGFADYEPAYLPNGDIIFASTRCVQTVDCWWTEASNLYVCAPDGRFLRRLTFDQVHSIYPQVLDDGRVIYTRWDYNDRGQIYPQPLFQMNADGTGQTEFYGNNSWFPTTIAHARGIPGTQKVLAVFCGHHTAQAGKLGVLDPARGRQENSGAQLVAPVRPTPAERIDAYGQSGELFQYPHPLTASEFLVTYAPLGWNPPKTRQSDARFGIYWMDMDGRRELLASDPLLPCQQPVPLAVRPRPTVQPSRVDYRKEEGRFYVQNIYAGPGLTGVEPGTVKALRVVALEFRAAGIGKNFSRGPGGAALASTPVSIGNGCWDVKKVLGTATVREDGSAFFAVPARTPVYFQALDDKGRAIQTMRSWSTLQPGEVASCTGCHEHKNTAPLPGGRGYPPGTLALRAGPETLRPFYGPPRGFSFAREIQPILDRHCVRCHDQRSPAPPTPAGSSPALPGEPQRAFSLLGKTTSDGEALRHWSDAYLFLVGAHHQDWKKDALMGADKARLVNWVGAQSVAEPLPPYFAGSTRSALPELLEEGHQGVRLSEEERDKINCWIDLMVPYCGDYTEANAWPEAEKQKYQRYLAKRLAMEAVERQNIAELVTSQ